MTLPVTLEICCSDPASLENAIACGADRVELCCAISEGGLTPPMSMVCRAVEAGIESVNVLVRPRGGGFVYTRDEVAAMCADIRQVKKAGATGVVIGAMTLDRRLDTVAMNVLVQWAEGLECVLSRSIDDSRDMDADLEAAIAVGCRRILTSGGAPTALEGAETIRRMVRLADGRAVVMAGAGVTPANVQALLVRAAVTAVHTTARSSGGRIEADGSLFGHWTGSGSDPAVIKQLQEILNHS